RFFTVTELKVTDDALMMAHILENWNVTPEPEGVRPPSEWFGTAFGENRATKLLSRKSVLGAHSRC
ncbi:hypothetical protein FB451DRAFT_1034879, partial [Mycena latifolia]